MATSVRTAGAAALIALALACLAPTAHATHVACGDTITADTTLDSNLSCTGDGLVIATDDVTLDLAGHSIAGTDRTDTGVRTDFVARPQVRNGAISGFQYGIFGESVEGFRVARMVLSDNGLGFGVFGNEGPGEIVETTAAGNAFGLNLDGGVRVARSRIVDNERVGIALDFTRATIEDNVIARNATGIDIEEAEALVIRNRITGNREYGLRYGYWQDGTVRENTIARNGTGLSAGISVLTIERNTFAANSKTGLSAAGSSQIVGNLAQGNGEDGIAVTSGGCGAVRRNVAYRNGANGIRIAGGGPEEEPCSSAPAPVEDNHVHRNTLDGILVTGNVSRVALTGNRTERNGDDGIDVDPQAAFQRGFDWSPDAQVLAIGLAPDEHGQESSIWLVRADDTANRRLVAGSYPVWSPDGSEIVFRGTFDGQSGLWAIRPDGSGLRFVTATVGEDVQWSPAGDRIYLRDAEGIKVVPAAGGTATLLARGSNPELSPDGTQIVFQRAPDVWIMDANGSDQRILTEQAGGPSWSPDGERIVLTDGFDLFTIDAGGGEPQYLTIDDPRDLSPDWSPDGELIAFLRLDASGGSALYTIRPDGTGLTLLTRDFRSAPRWTPDSRGIAAGNVVVNRDGSVTTLSPGENPLVTLTRNQADRNADLGIEAADGVTDGGGNRARGNGDPRQCVNVACG